ncbi:methionine synthase reductase [Procambarus clarkii]|uniref:methionine synthase reductase n=1 Tax=Procambarus clarkii TaxID=6728 RepID=UPI001E670F6C|nr:methionine synthase reductase-like [Procambarus clarkii]
MVDGAGIVVYTGEGCEGGTDVLVVYASQTGNAKAIAEEVVEGCCGAGLRGELRCCSQLGQDLHNISCLVLVGSTTGDGDPPDTAREFWRHLHQKDQPVDTLSHLSYTVLGLGDTNYTHFCNFGKTIDQKLQALGGNRFYACGWADDGTGLEIVIEPWIEGLIPTLKTFLTKREVSRPVSNNVSVQEQDTAMEDIRERVLSSKVCEEKFTNDVNPSVKSTITSANNLKASMNSLTVNGEAFEDRTSIISGMSDSQVDEKRAYSIDVVADKYNIDILSPADLQCLPVKLCAYPASAKLTLPVQAPPYLTIVYLDDSERSPIQSDLPLPSAASEVVQACVISARKLTKVDAVKTALEVTLKLPKEKDRFVYEPGDSFGIIVKNPVKDVEILLNLLQISDIADKICELSIIPNTKKRSAAVPKFIPSKSSVKYILEHCLDIRSVPKKPLIRTLLEYTSNSSEKRRLQELVSKEGASEYSKYVRGASLTLLDFLIIFQSCKPPVTTLLEHLPQLQPRAYSIATSPLVDSEHISFVFNIVEIPKENTVTYSRKGICTGWLASVYNELAHDTTDFNKMFRELIITDRPDVQVCANIYLRSNQSFRLPKNLATPIVMVGPGTGVAPFVGFLQHRQRLMATKPSDVFGDSWLFFGCRNKEQDFLYKEELERFHEQGILNHLIVSFSRDSITSDGSKYVQDSIIKHGAVLSSLLLNSDAVVYVCGDAQNMAKDVFEAFVSILQTNSDITEISARQCLAKMQIDKKYLQDVWS